jgi:hypothetical protein
MIREKLGVRETRQTGFGGAKLRAEGVALNGPLLGEEIEPT